MIRSLLAASVGWIGISMVADGVPALLLPYQLARGGTTDASTLGAISFVAIATAALIQPAAGHWSDRAGRFPVAAAGTFAAIIGLGLMLQPGAALPGAVLALAGVSVAQAGQQPLLPDLVPRSWRGRGGGLKSAFDVAGAFLAFVLLAALLGVGDTGAAVGTLGMALVIGFGLTAVLVGPRMGRAGARSTQPSLAAAYRLDLGEHRDLLTLIAARFLVLLGIFVVGRFLLLFVAARLGLSPEAAGSQAGVVLAVLAGLTVAASVPSGWLADRVGRGPLMLGGAALAAVGIGLLPMASSLELVLVIGAAMALGSAAFTSASWAQLADLTAGSESGRLMGIAHLGTAGAAAAAGAFGFLIDAAGYEPAFALAGLLAVAGGVVAWRLPTDAARQGRLIGPAEVAR